MIRGVKKQVIEVNVTESKYFDRAILLVSDRYCELDSLKLRSKAKEYVLAINPENILSENKGVKNDKLPKKSNEFFKLIFSFVIGLAVALISFR